MTQMGFRNVREIRDLLIPEIKPANELTVWAGYAQVDPQKCSKCGLCLEIGHCNAIILTEEAAEINPDLCQGCSTCIDLCPQKAIRMVEVKDKK